MNKLTTNKGFSYEKHEEVGVKLQEIRDYLLDLHCDITRNYPKKPKVPRTSYEAYVAVDKLRSALDDCVCQENHDKSNQDVVEVYYRSTRKDKQLCK